MNTQTYSGTGGGSFGGPIGSGSTLTFSSDGTTLTGTLTIGGNHAFNDEFVIYIDAKSGGLTSTSSLTDTGSGDFLRQATSGYNGSKRATLDMPTNFGADYAIALSPAQAKFGSFYTLNNDGSLTYGSNGGDGNTNLTPTNTNNGNNTNTYTFTVALSLLGNASSFNFATTYLNGHSDIYRSNEAIGNTIIDETDPNNTGSLAQDRGMLTGFSTFSTVPEPGTWLAGFLTAGSAVVLLRRRFRLGIV